MRPPTVLAAPPGYGRRRRRDGRDKTCRAAPGRRRRDGRKETFRATPGLLRGAAPPSSGRCAPPVPRVASRGSPGGWRARAARRRPVPLLEVLRVRRRLDATTSWKPAPPGGGGWGLAAQPGRGRRRRRDGRDETSRAAPGRRRRDGREETSCAAPGLLRGAATPSSGRCAPPVPRGAPVPLGSGHPLPAIIEIGCAYCLALAANHLDCGRLVDSWDL